MAQPMYDIGKEAALMLIRCLREEGADSIRGRRLVLSHRLEVRQSTAAPGKTVSSGMPGEPGASGS